MIFSNSLQSGFKPFFGLDINDVTPKRDISYTEGFPSKAHLQERKLVVEGGPEIDIEGDDPIEKIAFCKTKEGLNVYGYTIARDTGHRSLLYVNGHHRLDVKGKDLCISVADPRFYFSRTDLDVLIAGYISDEFLCYRTSKDGFRAEFKAVKVAPNARLIKIGMNTEYKFQALVRNM